MKTLTITWALAQMIISVGLLLIAPMLYEDKYLASAVVTVQLICSAIAAAAIALLLAKKWTALCWLMSISVVYTILDLGWRIGTGNSASVIVAATVISGWQAFALAIAIKNRKAPVRTS